MDAFVSLFKFNPALAGHIGIEREAFLTRKGAIVPIAAEIIPQIGHPAITNEFSACQIEDRIGPSRLQDVRDHIVAMDNELRKAEKALDFTRLVLEVAPDSMPLDCYPDPEGRYATLRDRLTTRQLLAAHQVTGTHIHIGMGDPESALRIYNRTVPHWERLCAMGDGSNGRRLALYPLVAADYIPRTYTDWPEMYNYARSNGWDEDPKKCYHLIRISAHGTIEFRMFGVTEDVDRIMDWVNTCAELCSE